MAFRINGGNWSGVILGAMIAMAPLGLVVDKDATSPIKRILSPLLLLITVPLGVLFGVVVTICIAIDAMKPKKHST